MVSMWQAMVNFWQRAFDFTGRSTRAEYWWMRLWAVLILGLWFVVLAVAMTTTGQISYESTGGKNAAADWVNFLSALTHHPLPLVVLIVGGVIALVALIPWVSLWVRRILDTGLPTWLAWVVTIGKLVGLAQLSGGLGTLTDWVGTIAGWALFITALLPTDQFNKQ